MPLTLWDLGANTLWLVLCSHSFGKAQCRGFFVSLSPHVGGASVCQWLAHRPAVTLFLAHLTASQLLSVPWPAKPELRCMQHREGFQLVNKQVLVLLTSMVGCGECFHPLPVWLGWWKGSRWSFSSVSFLLCCFSRLEILQSVRHSPGLDGAFLRPKVGLAIRLFSLVT